jgi:thioredoxin reductase (NADPH)
MLTSSELKKIPIFSCLNDANLMWLSQQAADLHLEPGEYHIHEGEPTPFLVVLEGTTEVLKGVWGVKRRFMSTTRAISSANCPFSWQRRLP